MPITDYVTIPILGLPYVCWFDVRSGRPFAIIPARPGPVYSIHPEYACPLRSYPVADMSAAVQSLIAASLDLACPSVTSL